MVRLRRLNLIVALLFAVQSAAAQTPAQIADYVVEPEEIVAGKPLDHFANAWWQWAYAMQQAQSPVRDQDGTYCAVSQDGPVWYLAGGFGTSKIHRTCIIPARKHIFFPVINMVYSAPPGSTLTCDEAKQRAAQNNNDFVYINVFLNGTKLENAERFRLASITCFDLFERVPIQFQAPVAAPSATDGYWIMLEPLPAGTHQLEFQAFYTANGSSFGDMVQNISYDLTILAP